MAEPCKERYNFEFDKCIYKAGYKLIKDKFNCTFELLLNSTGKIIRQETNECRIEDLTNIRQRKMFYDILAEINQGRMIRIIYKIWLN